MLRIMNKFATKAASSALAFAMLAGSTLAAVQPGDTMYPATPVSGARLELIDGVNNDLKDLYMDLSFRAGEETLYNAGTVYVYGNGKDDTNGRNYFDEVDFTFSGTVTSYGVVVKNSSNTNKVVYDVVFDDDANGTDAFVYTETNKVPGSSLSSVRSYLQNTNVTAPANVVATSLEAILSDQLDDVIGASNVMKGDPDAMTDYFDEIWVYAEIDGEEYAWHMDVELSSVMQDKETANVSAVKVVTRGTHGRVDITPGNMSGVTGWVVEIDGGLYTTDEVETQYPVVFFETEIDEEYDVTVYTLNAEGDKSEDGVEVEGSESERVDMTSTLKDLKDSKFYNQAQYLYKLGIVDGYSNGNFGPDDTVTRGQIAKFTMNAFGLPFNMGGEMFSDVKATDTFAPYIQSLKNAGVIGGYSDGTFRADEKVTRAQVTKFVFEAATFFVDDAVETSSCNFADKASFGVFAPYICGLAEHADDSYEAIIGGYSNGNFGPNDSLTRGQMAKIILNAGAMVDGTATGDPFIYVPTFDRVFVAPIAVEDFDDDAVTDAQVDLAWEDLGIDDTSVDGYIIERREDGDSKWDDLDGVDTSVDGVLPAGTDTFSDDDVDDDTKYEYRLAAFKWIPVDYSSENYAGQAAMELDTEERTNMVIGPWVTLSVKTKKS